MARDLVHLPIGAAAHVKEGSSRMNGKKVLSVVPNNDVLFEPFSLNCRPKLCYPGESRCAGLPGSRVRDIGHMFLYGWAAALKVAWWRYHYCH